MTSPDGIPFGLPERWRLQALLYVQARAVEWLVPGLIPLRALTLVAGVGGLGKSTYLLARAAELSRLGFDSIVVSFEDTAAEVIRPRVEAAGGDLARVHVVVLKEAAALDTVQLPRDLADLRALVTSVGARLVIIDPIVAALELGYDAHKDQHVRSVLAQLVRLAEEENAAVALVGHLNKGASTDAYIRVGNSIAFWNASRSVLLVVSEGDEDDGLRLVAQKKTNWGRQHPIERHRLEGIILPETVDPTTGKPITTSRMVFVETADDVNGDELLRANPPNKTETAEELLRALLADGQWHESGGIKQVLGAASFPERTVKRAAADLGVEHERRGMPSKTWWRVTAPVGPRSGHGGANTPADGPTGLLAGAFTGLSGVVEPDPQLGLPRVSTTGPTASVTRLLVVGGPGYPLLADTAHRNGHLTEREHRMRLRLHFALAKTNRKEGA